MCKIALALAFSAYACNGRRLQATVARLHEHLDEDQRSSRQLKNTLHSIVEVNQLQSDGPATASNLLTRFATLLVLADHPATAWQGAGFGHNLASHPTRKRAGSHSQMFFGDGDRKDVSDSPKFALPFGKKEEASTSPKFALPFGKKEPKVSDSPKFVLPFGKKEQQDDSGKTAKKDTEWELPGPVLEAWEATPEPVKGGVLIVKGFVSEIRPLQVLSGFLVAVGLFTGSVFAAGNAVGSVLAENGNGQVLERAIQFGTIFENIKDAYVDKNVDLDLLFEKGVNSMLTTLDPYSTYENAKESEEIVLRTTGKYAGVGITIGKDGEKVIVFAALEGYAYNAGVRPGDRIVKVDDKPVGPLSMDEVKDLLRGEPGTTVDVTVTRDGSSEPELTIPIKRQLVRLPDVTLATIDDKGNGYLKLEGFSEGTAEETERAISLMQKERNLKALVIDMRDNPGGVLDAAVAVSQQLVPEGTEIVSTAGRAGGMYGERSLSYRSTKPPLLNPGTRLVMLVNGNTASAAEIVAGAVQDTDSGIVVGERTFGKGLVQVVEPLPAGGSLKLTVAKYFTPSGRSIQAAAYREGRLKATVAEAKEAAQAADAKEAPKPADASEDAEEGPDPGFSRLPSRGQEAARLKGGIVPDFKSFATKNGRVVKGGGGIVPDVVVEAKQLGDLESSLLQRGLFFDFASDWLKKHPGPTTEIAKAVVRTQDDIFQDFASYVRSKAVPLAKGTSKEKDTSKASSSLEPAVIARQLDALEKTLGSKGLNNRDRSVRELATLRQILLDEELEDLRTQKKELQEDLVETLLGRVTPPSTRLAARVANDPQVQEAQRLAADAAAYKNILEPAPKTATAQELAGRAALFPPDGNPNV